ncbi:hypothetical protein BTA51_03930 [Hahella sp. CCB-MM4]|nr:hypothetical protein BTA51_03930 [Hahella sp. CCB-MM4]
MWAYAFLAYATISSPIPGIIGFIASMVHLLSPLLFRVTNNGLLVCSIMLGAGMVHQGSFSYFTGGFNSHILIWLGILPMLGGIIIGRKGVLLWATLILVHLMLLEKHERDLSRKNKNISVLLRVLNHDIATPISLISMASTGLRSKQEDSREMSVDIVEKACNTMVEISQSVRNMYSVEAGNLSITPRPYPLNECIHNLCFIMQASLDKKSIHLNYDFEQHKDLMIFVDPIAFNNQIMGNIISNAIKFSYRGGSIDITAEQHQDYAKVMIRDYGVGMSQSLVEKLFSVEENSSRAGTEAETGSGYGMSIMKAFIDKLQGNVEVQSSEKSPDRPESGTLFTLFLPIRQPSLTM